MLPKRLQPVASEPVENHQPYGISARTILRNVPAASREIEYSPSQASKVVMLQMNSAKTVDRANYAHSTLSCFGTRRLWLYKNKSSGNYSEKLCRAFIDKFHRYRTHFHKVQSTSKVATPTFFLSLYEERRDEVRGFYRPWPQTVYLR